MVSIVCLAFNHEKYIRQCLDGFVMQQTDFPFEIIIHDDASSDRTADIIREYEAKYPHLFTAIYQTENQYSKGIPLGRTYLYPRVRGKYIAECEGDDRWSDPLKLQKQADFLESHPDYSLCCTECEMFHEALGEKSFTPLPPDGDISREDMIADNRVYTLTAMFRSELLWKYFEEISPKMPAFLMGDYPLWLYFLSEGKIWKFPDITAVYRIREESVSHSRDALKRVKFVMSAYDIKCWANKVYSWGFKDIRKGERKVIRSICRDYSRHRPLRRIGLYIKCLGYWYRRYFFDKTFIK